MRKVVFISFWHLFWVNLFVESPCKAGVKSIRTTMNLAIGRVYSRALAVFSHGLFYRFFTQIFLCFSRTSSSPAHPYFGVLYNWDGGKMGSWGDYHARMKEIQSYLHIPKTKTMCYMHEASYSDWDPHAFSVPKQRMKV